MVHTSYTLFAQQRLMRFEELFVKVGTNNAQLVYKIFDNFQFQSLYASLSRLQWLDKFGREI